MLFHGVEHRSMGDWPTTAIVPPVLIA